MPCNNAQLYVSDTKIRIIPLEVYLDKVKQDGKKQVDTKILDFDIQDNMAYVKTKFKYPNAIYIDYLILLKQNNTWKIVSKTFTQVVK